MTTKARELISKIRKIEYDCITGYTTYFESELKPYEYLKEYEQSYINDIKDFEDLGIKMIKLLKDCIIPIEAEKDYKNLIYKFGELTKEYYGQKSAIKIKTEN